MERYPQIVTLHTGVASVTDTYSVDEFVLPVAATPTGQKFVFEILSVDWYHAIENLFDLVVTHWAFLSTQASRANGESASRASMHADALNGHNFAMDGFIGAGSGSREVEFPTRIDLSDGAGRGYLIANDRIFITRAQLFTADVPADSVCKILYRLIPVSVMEYVAIAQGQ